jgi:hypothetical protein
MTGEKSRAARFMQVQPLLDEISSQLISEAERPVFGKPVETAEIGTLAAPETEGALDLEQLFNQASLEKNEAAEIQAFWERDRAAGEQADQPENGKLSFEQARRLGLAPDN